MAGPDFRSAAVLAAQHAGIDPAIFSRQISQESGFNPNAMSPAGAVGIAQIVPRYHPDVNPRNPLQSLRWAANYDAGLIKKYGGWAPALSVYNSGQPNSYKDPHFAKGQTFNYVKNILSGQNSSLNTNTKSIGGSYQRAPDHAPGTQAAVANWLMKQSMSLLNGGYGQDPSSLVNLLTQPSQGATAAPVASQTPSRLKGSTVFAGGFLPTKALYTEERADQGRDLQTNPGGPIISPGVGKVVRIAVDPNGFGTGYPIIHYTTGPYAGKDIYIGHTKAAVQAGQTVYPGDILGHTGTTGAEDWNGNASKPGWAEIGFAPNATPGSFGQPTPF